MCNGTNSGTNDRIPAVFDSASLRAVGCHGVAPLQTLWGGRRSARRLVVRLGQISSTRSRIRPGLAPLRVRARACLSLRLRSGSDRSRAVSVPDLVPFHSLRCNCSAATCQRLRGVRRSRAWLQACRRPRRDVSDGSGFRARAASAHRRRCFVTADGFYEWMCAGRSPMWASTVSFTGRDDERLARSAVLLLCGLPVLTLVLTGPTRRVGTRWLLRSLRCARAAMSRRR